MSQTSSVDFGRTAEDYARHRAGFPESFFKKMMACEALAGRKRVLDLGTGTGTVARGFAREGFEVTGLDIAQPLLDQAQFIDKKEGLSIGYVVGSAEQTGFPDGTFDIVTAGQCFHWFDRAKAEPEIRRILKPRGLFIVAYFDWIETPDNPVGQMRPLQKKYNPDWNGFPRWYPQKPGDLVLEGFSPVFSFLYEEGVPYTHEGWRGRIRSYAGVGGSMTKPNLEAFDAEFARVLGDKFENPMRVPHKVWGEVWQLQS